jgi:biopolymer transport protein ExbB/TolQ
MLPSNFSDLLRVVSASLAVPVFIVLAAALALTVVMLGTLAGEVFTERLRLKVRLPQLVDEIRAPEADIPWLIQASGLLKRQKAALLELAAHPQLTHPMREALAVRLLFEEQSHYDNVLRVTDTIAKLGPMLGLLGTLIPLGPGLIAMGQGDTYTLSLSLLTAFDTTIAGLAAAAAAYVISGVRRSWYENYMTLLETLMLCVLGKEEAFGRHSGEEPA